MAYGLQVTINGLAVGLQYALLLFGLLFIYRSSRILNFAHGQIGMIGAISAFLVVAEYGMPTWLAVSVGVMVASFLSAAVDILIVRRMNTHSKPGLDMIITLGIFLALGSLGAVMLSGGRARRFPEMMPGGINLWGAYIAGTVVLSLIVSAAIFALVYLFLIRTRAGAVLRAIATDPSMAAVSGWRVERWRTAAWAVAGATSGIAAILIASRNAVSPEFLIGPLIKAFFAGALGGFHRVVAPVMVAIGIGLAENWVGALWGAQYRVPAVFLGAVLILALLPMRWLGQSEEARA